MHTSFFSVRTSAWLAALGLSACTTLAPAPSGGSGAQPAAAASAPTVVVVAVPQPAGSAPRPPGAAPVPVVPVVPAGPLRPFAEVIKDAKRIDGLLTLWQKDDKVWLELKPEDLNQPFFLSPKLKTGIGDIRFFGGLMSSEAGLVEFRRIHNQVQLIWRNTEFTAKAGTPTGRAVEAAFSPSLLASTPVLSLPQPERKSVLIEANAMFVADLLGTGAELQRAYRQGYNFDSRNSAITAVRATPELVVLEVLGHFATGSIAVPQPGSPPGAPVPTTPRSVPDPRSLFITC